MPRTKQPTTLIPRQHLISVTTYTHPDVWMNAGPSQDSQEWEVVEEVLERHRAAIRTELYALVKDGQLSTQAITVNH